MGRVLACTLAWKQTDWANIDNSQLQASSLRDAWLTSLTWAADISLHLTVFHACRYRETGHSCTLVFVPVVMSVFCLPPSPDLLRLPKT